MQHYRYVRAQPSAISRSVDLAAEAFVPTRRVTGELSGSLDASLSSNGGNIMSSMQAYANLYRQEPTVSLQ